MLTNSFLHFRLIHNYWSSMLLNVVEKILKQHDITGTEKI